MGVDYLERQARNRDIGLKGELLVVEHERCGCRKSHPCRLSGMSVLVEDAAEAVPSVDVEPGGGVRLGDR